MTEILRFLHLEDDSNDSELARATLASGGIECEIVIVMDQDQYVAALDAGGFDLILSDYALPSFDGIEALELAHKKYPDIPFIFLSGVMGEDLAIDSLKKGATDYVLKNRMSRLVPAVQRALQEHKERVAHMQAEEELRKFARVVEQSPNSVIITDTSGVIEYVNPKFTKLTGYSIAEAAGQNPRILKSGETPSKTYKTMWETISNGETWHGVLHNRKKNGELYWESATIAPLKSTDGVVTKYFAIKEDITEKRKLEEQLLQSQKMEVIGQLSGGIAHDLNNILTAIIGFSTLIEMKMSDDDPIRENLNHVIAASDRAAELTKSLLAFSRKQILNPQPVDINQIIGKSRKFMSRIIPENIEFKVLFKREELFVNADSGQLEQVLMNLVTNARDAMLNGGTLSIETDTVVIDSDYINAHGYGELGEYAEMTVSDTGVGMDSATCKKVFEPFFTTKEVGKGTGLGLSIVYGIIKQHHGYINVYSEPGNGTAFKIYLPLIKSAVVSILKSDDEVLHGGEETILVADDDILVRQLLETVLRQYGYTVINAMDGSEAVERFKENPIGINLVILDVLMPKMNGKEVYEEIKRINPDIKVIFMSGYTREIINQQDVLEQHLEFLPKPLNPRQLLVRVRNVLDGVSSGKD